MMVEKEYASKGVAGTGLGLGAAGLGLGVINSLGGLMGGRSMLGGCMDAAAGAAIPAAAAMVASNGGIGNGCQKYASQHQLQDIKEMMHKDERIAELETDVKLRDANAYTDKKLVEVYTALDSKYGGAVAAINEELKQAAIKQAVQEQATKDGFVMVRQDLDRERSERKCSDNTIVNYCNSTFYPKRIAQVTVGSTTSDQPIYNPLRNGCDCGE